MSTVKYNIIANYLGTAWNALMGLAFIPIYIRHLGMEAYGLIGVFALLQAWAMLLDMGLTPTFSREMARFKAEKHSPQSIGDLVRSVELVYAPIAVTIAIVVILGSPWLATDWLKAEHLPATTVETALSITGCIIAIRWLAGLYRSALIGLQHQVWLNVCTAIFSTLRNVGVIGVLIWVSPTIQAFFTYQGVLFGIETLVLATHMRRMLPIAPLPVRFRWQSLLHVWRFAAGMTTITLLATLVTQIDKLLLSKLLSLTEFGHYTLASTVAAALSLMFIPITNVARPRLCELVAHGDMDMLVKEYHYLSQLLSLAVVPAALVLAMFSDHALLLWTHDIATTRAVAPFVSLLVIGYMLNGLLNLPYALQLAYGKTNFAIWSNAIAVLILVPSIYVGVTTYGAKAAALIWILLNLGYIAIALPVMHRTMLPGEKWSWYSKDVIAPMIAAAIPIVIIYLNSASPSLEHPLASASILVAAIISAEMSAILVTPFGRRQFYQLRFLIKTRQSKV